MNFDGMFDCSKINFNRQSLKIVVWLRVVLYCTDLKEKNRIDVKGYQIDFPTAPKYGRINNEKECI